MPYLAWWRDLLPKPHFLAEQVKIQINQLVNRLLSLFSTWLWPGSGWGHAEVAWMSGCGLGPLARRQQKHLWVILLSDVFSEGNSLSVVTLYHFKGRLRYSSITQGKPSTQTTLSHWQHSCILYNWLIWRVLKLAFFFQKTIFPCIYFGVWSSQNNAIFM